MKFPIEQERILQSRILRLRRVAKASFSSPTQCDPRGAFLYNRERSFLLYKKVRHQSLCLSDAGLFLTFP
ncbi:hypothetical protein CLOM621_08930 [Clostridium sp. M62/1]|nr:hypothetical protein CLOM621_08930 [Clostridium sp. M62/1]